MRLMTLTSEGGATHPKRLSDVPPQVREGSLRYSSVPSLDAIELAFPSDCDPFSGGGP